MTPTKTEGGASNRDMGEREFPHEADFLTEACWNAFGTYRIPGATDESGRLAHGFVPTRYELAVLARHYREEVYHYDYLYEVGGQTSSTGERFEPFAWKRIATIKGFIGEEELRKAIVPIEERWNTLLADAKERCQAKGVDHPQELDAENFAELIEGAGFIAIPQSELRPMDELLDPRRDEKQ